MKRFRVRISCLILSCCLLVAFESKAATIDNFVGTWAGHVTLTMPDEVFVSSIVLRLKKEGGILGGTFEKDNETTVTIYGPVIDGVFLFDLPCDDPNNIDCQGYNVQAEARLTNNMGTMAFTATGKFCDHGGAAPGTVTGTLTKSVIPVVNFLLLKE